MEIKFNIDQNLSKEKAEFWLKKMTTKVKRAVSDLQTEQEFLWGYQERKAYPIEFSQIYLIQVKNEKTYICTENGNYQLKGRLYQVKNGLRVQISRRKIKNLKERLGL
jgi:DNA-binding LytR/AlgR family response regulator